jgi:hypothetical protein
VFLGIGFWLWPEKYAGLDEAIAELVESQDKGLEEIE